MIRSRKFGIEVAALRGPLARERPFEIVERKGIGHPDSICDGVAEAVAAALAREYRTRCGGLQPFNADKSLLLAGRAEYRFGGGHVAEPMRLILGDRATREVGGVVVPVADIAEEAARAWFRGHLPHVRPDKDLLVDVALGPAAGELAELFRHGGQVPANDTSAAVGYAPLSGTEWLVLETERFLNGKAFKRDFPETGQDVKVMGVRTDRHLTLTVAMPLIAAYIDSEVDYFLDKQRILAALREHVEALVTSPAGPDLAVDVALNTLDCPGRAEAGAYLTVLGTSAEGSDSGQVGRGNRVNGLISLFRPASGEAAAGKNPLSHPGKVYNVLSFVLADRILREVHGLSEVYVWLCSRIGSPLDRPLVAAAEVGLEPGVALGDVATAVGEAIEKGLAELPEFTDRLARGELNVF